MSIESDLFDTLKGLVSNRVFPDFAPFSTARPFITYQQIGGSVIQPLSGGIPHKKNARMQINIWADTRLSASTISAQVEDALRSASVFIAKPESALNSTYEEDLRIYGAAQDFSIWYST